MSSESREESSYSCPCKPGFPAATVILLVLGAAFWASTGLAQSEATPTDDIESQLGLADLTAYRAALSGKATTDGAKGSGPPRSVTFRDLWNHPETWSGRRVQVEGRIVRLFRQDAVGSFPALVEAWLVTPAGDLFCVEFPRDERPERKDEASEPGRPVKFTGTFLKTIRYAAGDQARLAPLIVGDRPPAASRNESAAETGPVSSLFPAAAAPMTGQAADRGLDIGSPAAWVFALVLGMTAPLVLAWRHVRGDKAARRSGPRHAHRVEALAGPPLEFVETEPVNAPDHSALRSD